MSLVKGTNSYVTSEEADCYMEYRADESAWETASSVDQDKALVTAFHYLDNLPWQGRVANANQVQAWPRVATIYVPSRGRSYSYNGTETEAPREVKQAQYEMALHIISNPGITGSSSDVSSVTVGPLSVDFSSQVSSVPRRVLSGVEEFLTHVPGSSNAPRRIN